LQKHLHNCQNKHTLQNPRIHTSTHYTHPHMNMAAMDTGLCVGYA